MRTTLGLDSVAPLVEGRHGDPFALLGPHDVQDRGRAAVAVRAFLPEARQALLLDAAGPLPIPPRTMRKIHPSGLFEAICPANFGLQAFAQGGAPSSGRRYQIQVLDERGQATTMHDPYSFSPLLTDFDLHLFGEGNFLRGYEKFGAQLRTIDGVSGVNFAVWAPNASAVSVVGDFNSWDVRRHPLRKLIPSGVWELFIPKLRAGEKYKFVVRHGHEVCEKADPYGFAAECPPHTASMVADLSWYPWKDQEWIANRAATQALDKPMCFYEVHLGSWRRPGDDPSKWLPYRELAQQLVEYVKQMGYTHIELLPVSEHPLSASWGYQTVGYFAATARFGPPEDLMYLVDHCHQNGIGVIIDWVPAHFPRDAHGLRRFDGTALYEHADPRQGEHRDWGTMIFNYGRNEVSNFLLSNALFWLDKYHIDGLRVDAVASMLYLDYSREAGDWIPNKYGGRENLEAISFIKNFNEQVHGLYPGALTIAEESTAWSAVSRPTYVGGLGFSLKWNMGWMNDTRRYMHHEPIHRRYHHDELTFSMVYSFHENFVLPLSHDEVVHGKGSLLDQMPGDLWQRFANLRLMYSYMWTHPGKKLLFMGGEFGQWNEWNFDESLQWHLLEWDSHKGVQKLCADLNFLLRREPALHEIDFDYHGFEWIDCHDYDDSTLSFLRKAKDPNNFLVVVCNFTPVPRQNFKLGVPRGGWYQEVFNSDSTFYGGSNLGNYPGILAEPHESHGRPHSIRITVPPLAAVVLKPQ